MQTVSTVKVFCVVTMLLILLLLFFPVVFLSSCVSPSLSLAPPTDLLIIHRVCNPGPFIQTSPDCSVITVIQASQLFCLLVPMLVLLVICFFASQGHPTCLPAYLSIATSKPPPAFPWLFSDLADTFTQPPSPHCLLPSSYPQLSIRPLSK